MPEVNTVYKDSQFDVTKVTRVNLSSATSQSQGRTILKHTLLYYLFHSNADHPSSHFLPLIQFSVMVRPILAAIR